MASVGDLLAGGGKSWSADKPGDFVRGTVTAAEVQQQTNLDTDEPEFWDVAKTRPKMMVVATLGDVTEGNKNAGTAAAVKQTDDDDGKRVVYFSGNKFTALRNSGAKDLRPGDVVEVVHTEESDREPKKKGHNRAKLYSVEYTKGAGPGVSLGEDGPAVASSSATSATSTTATTSATHGPRPDSIPEALWSTLSVEQKAQLAPAPAGPAKPEFIPAAVWDTMDEAQRKLAAGF